MEYSEEGAARALQFQLGKYFNKFAPKIMKGAPPSKQFWIDQSLSFAHSVLLIAFVPDFNSLFDSTLLIEAASQTPEETQRVNLT